MLVRALWQYRGFIGGMVGREFQARYLHSLLGSTWSVLNPAALIFAGPEDTLTLGAIVASEMFGHRIPVIRLSDQAFAVLSSAKEAVITPDGVENLPAELACRFGEGVEIRRIVHTQILWIWNRLAGYECQCDRRFSELLRRILHVAGPSDSRMRLEVEQERVKQRPGFVQERSGRWNLKAMCRTDRICAESNDLPALVERAIAQLVLGIEPGKDQPADRIE